MKKKYKFTLYFNGDKVAFCFVSRSQKTAFENLMSTLSSCCKRDRKLLEYGITEIAVD